MTTTYGDYHSIAEFYEHTPSQKPQTTVGKGIAFNRTRRITGYLVGDKSRFCNAKAKEEQDRVKHM